MKIIALFCVERRSNFPLKNLLLGTNVFQIVGATSACDERNILMQKRWDAGSVRPLCVPLSGRN